MSGYLDRAENARLAALLTPRFTVLNYYRRGHGDSGDTQPWAIKREVEDLEAVIDEAGGSSVFGSSGNGIFALEAAACGLAARILKLAEATRGLVAGYLAGERRRDG
jgi:pimeloyl-ACP methyl ester carboxylesterase